MATCLFLFKQRYRFCATPLFWDGFFLNILHKIECTVVWFCFSLIKLYIIRYVFEKKLDIYTSQSPLDYAPSHPPKHKTTFYFWNLTLEAGVLFCNRPTFKRESQRSEFEGDHLLLKRTPGLKKTGRTFSCLGLTSSGICHLFGEVFLKFQRRFGS